MLGHASNFLFYFCLSTAAAGLLLSILLRHESLSGLRSSLPNKKKLHVAPPLRWSNSFLGSTSDEKSNGKIFAEVRKEEMEKVLYSHFYLYQKTFTKIIISQKFIPIQSRFAFLNKSVDESAIKNPLIVSDYLSTLLSAFFLTRGYNTSLCSCPGMKFSVISRLGREKDKAFINLTLTAIIQLEHALRWLTQKF
jgi:hypothetical protein